MDLTLTTAAVLVVLASIAYLALVIAAALQIIASGHSLLGRVAWLGIVIVAPFLGSLAWFGLGRPADPRRVELSH